MADDRPLATKWALPKGAAPAEYSGIYSQRIHILQGPDPAYALALAADLGQFERPHRVIDDYDLLLTPVSGKVVIQ